MPSEEAYCEAVYAIRRWSEGYFKINTAGHLCVIPNPHSLQPDTENAQTTIDLTVLAGRLRTEGLSLPVLVRFTDILRHRVHALRNAFEAEMHAAGYSGQYRPVYPIKVNQQREVLQAILSDGSIGLEAGSKPELLAVLGLVPKDQNVVCNGYKDRAYIRLALIGRRLGLRLYIVIEKPSELDLVLDEAARLEVQPLLGVRVRLAASATGNWQNSGGDRSKFGLSAHQMLRLVQRLRDEGKLGWLRMLHAHLGSQIPNIDDIRAGIAELGNYYGQLRAVGVPLDTLDVGGGLGVDYEGTRTRAYCSTNYDIHGYANAVVATLTACCRRRRLPTPHLITEAGRALSAHHAIIITDCVDREQAGGLDIPAANTEDTDVATLQRVLQQTQRGAPHMTPLALFEEAEAAIHRARTRFRDGDLDLRQRAETDELYASICRALRPRLSPNRRRQRELLDRINADLADKLFINLSVFQSLPDVWAIGQVFPILPLQRLTEPPTERCVVHDLTCDSDGCITKYVDADGVEASLPVHAFNTHNETYLLGIFMVGAYQEILGDIHNLFGRTDAVTVELDDNAPDGWRLLEIQRGDAAIEVLRQVHHDARALLTAYWHKLDAANLPQDARERMYLELKAGLYGYTYLDRL